MTSDLTNISGDFPILEVWLPYEIKRMHPYPKNSKFLLHISVRNEDVDILLHRLVSRPKFEFGEFLKLFYLTQNFILG